MVNPNMRSVNRNKQQDDRGTTVAQALFWAVNHLAAKGVDSPLREAQDLLAHTLKIERVKLLDSREQPVSPASKRIFETLLRRRARR